MTLPDLTCRACSYRGPDVTSRLVEVTPSRSVTVYATDAPVPERFRVEARCMDKDECLDRRERADIGKEADDLTRASA